MAKINSCGQDYTNNADGWDLTGGTTGRKLTVTGANITLTGSGTNVYTFPSSTCTLAGFTADLGGTGQTVYAVGDILYASATNALSKLADVATGSALLSGGVNTAPSWGQIGLTTHVTGTLPVANGGTGATTFTNNRVLTGNTTSAIVDEANLTFDGTTLAVTGKQTITRTNTTPNTSATVLDITFSNNTADTGVATNYGIKLTYSDSGANTAGSNDTVYGFYSSITQSGNQTAGAKNAYGMYSVVQQSGTNASGPDLRAYGGYFQVSITETGAGSAQYAVYGTATAQTDASYAGYFTSTATCSNGYGIWATATGGTTANWAGYFTGNVEVVSGVYIHALGSAGAPSFTFTGDTNTGMYSAGADQINWTTGGSLKLSLSTTALTSTLAVLGADGSAGAPQYSFSSETTIGMYRVSAGVLGFSAGSTLIFDITSTAFVFQKQSVGIAGTVTAPAYTFTGDLNTGIYSDSADTISFTCGGTKILGMLNTAVGLTAGTTNTVTGNFQDYVGTTHYFKYGLYVGTVAP